MVLLENNEVRREPWMAKQESPPVVSPVKKIRKRLLYDTMNIVDYFFGAILIYSEL